MVVGLCNWLISLYFLNMCWGPKEVWSADEFRGWVTRSCERCVVDRGVIVKTVGFDFADFRPRMEYIIAWLMEPVIYVKFRKWMADSAAVDVNTPLLLTLLPQPPDQ